MHRVVLAPEFGTLVLRDEDTGELSLECLCGGIALYSQRVVLTDEEAEEFAAGTLDLRRMVVEVCRQWHSMKDRIVAPVPAGEVVWPQLDGTQPCATTGDE